MRDGSHQRSENPRACVMGRGFRPLVTSAAPECASGCQGLKWKGSGHCVASPSAVLTAVLP